MIHRHLLAAALLAAVSTAGAQAPAGIAEGDKAMQARNAPAALTQYEAAVTAAPGSAEALWRAAHAAVILGEFSGDKRDSLYRLAMDYGRRAVAADSNNASARFALAEALGRVALVTWQPAEKLSSARGAYANGMACLKIDPKSAECAHIMGVWNAEVMRTDTLDRRLAISVMNATELADASWEKAANYLQQAIKAQPTRIVHHLDLGRVYAGMGDKAKAKTELQAAIQSPVSDYNDEHYKTQAQEELKALGN